MQRQLIIMRHAKSSWAEQGMADHERPLNERGRRAAPRVALEIQRLGWQPQLILSSDARRTRETTALLRATWDESVEVRFSSDLYLAGPRELAEAMAGVSDEVETLIAVGHNPGWESVVASLGRVDIVLKTATAVMLSAVCESWSTAFATEWSLENVVVARELE